METIDDIMKEMRGNAEHNHALVEVSKYLTEIADRIETAYNRLALPTPGQWTEIAQQARKISDLKRENESLKSELDRINLAVQHTLHAHRHEGTKDLAQEMVAEQGPVTREMIAGWAARVVDLGVYGSRKISRLKGRIEQQRVVAKSYCKYISRMEVALKPIQECKTFDEDQQEHDDIPSYNVLVKCHNAVRTAQRLFNKKRRSRNDEDR